MRVLGATLEVVEPGRVEIGVSFSEALCQQNGFLHAGVLTSGADAACGYAALTMAPPDHDVLAVEFKINLLAPARGAAFLAQGRVVRPGRTLTVCLAEVFAIEGALRTPIATMLSTVIVRPARDVGPGGSAGAPARWPRGAA